MRYKLIFILVFLPFLVKSNIELNKPNILDKKFNSRFRISFTIGIIHNEIFKKPNLLADTPFVFTPYNSYFYVQPQYGLKMDANISILLYKKFGVSSGITFVKTDYRSIQDVSAAKFYRTFFSDPPISMTSKYVNFFVPFLLKYEHPKFELSFGCLFSTLYSEKTQMVTLSNAKYEQEYPYKFANFKESILLKMDIKAYKDLYINLSYLNNDYIIKKQYSIGLTYYIL